jgi:hypothetical protein
MTTHRGADALGDFRCPVERGVRQERDELVPRVSRRDVVAAKVPAKDLGDLDEDIVALEVAVGVVDQLEMVDVDDEQRQRLVGSASGLDGRHRGVGERAAQRQPRQFIDANVGLRAGAGATRGRPSATVVVALTI